MDLLLCLMFYTNRFFIFGNEVSDNEPSEDILQEIEDTKKNKLLNFKDQFETMHQLDKSKSNQTLYTQNNPSESSCSLESSESRKKSPPPIDTEIDDPNKIQTFDISFNKKLETQKPSDLCSETITQNFCQNLEETKNQLLELEKKIEACETKINLYMTLQNNVACKIIYRENLIIKYKKKLVNVEKFHNNETEKLKKLEYLKNNLKNATNLYNILALYNNCKINLNLLEYDKSQLVNSIQENKKEINEFKIKKENFLSIFNELQIELNEYYETKKVIFNHYKDQNENFFELKYFIYEIYIKKLLNIDLKLSEKIKSNLYTIKCSNENISEQIKNYQNLINLKNSKSSEHVQIRNYVLEGAHKQQIPIDCNLEYIKTIIKIHESIKQICNYYKKINTLEKINIKFTLQKKEQSDKINILKSNLSNKNHILSQTDKENFIENELKFEYSYKDQLHKETENELEFTTNLEKINLIEDEPFMNFFKIKSNLSGNPLDKKIEIFKKFLKLNDVKTNIFYEICDSELIYLINKKIKRDHQINYNEIMNKTVNEEYFKFLDELNPNFNKSKLDLKLKDTNKIINNEKKNHVKENNIDTIKNNPSNKNLNAQKNTKKTLKEKPSWLVVLSCVIITIIIIIVIIFYKKRE